MSISASALFALSFLDDIALGLYLVHQRSKENIMAAKKIEQTASVQAFTVEQIAEMLSAPLPKKADGSFIERVTDSIAESSEGLFRVAGGFTAALENGKSAYRFEAARQQIRGKQRTTERAEQLHALLYGK